MGIIVKLPQHKIDATTAQIDRAVKKMVKGIEEGVEKAGSYAHRKLNASLNGGEKPLGQYRRGGQPLGSVGGGGLEVLAGPLSGQINAQSGKLREQNKMVTETLGIDPVKEVVAYVGFIGLFAVKATLADIDPTVTLPIAKKSPNRTEPLTPESVPLRVYAAEVIMGSERMIGRNVLRLTAQQVEASDKLARAIKKGIKSGLAKVREVK
jgi:hypothetical protein